MSSNAGSLAEKPQSKPAYLYRERPAFLAPIEQKQSEATFIPRQGSGPWGKFPLPSIYLSPNTTKYEHYLGLVPQPAQPSISNSIVQGDPLLLVKGNQLSSTVIQTFDRLPSSACIPGTAQPAPPTHLLPLMPTTLATQPTPLCSTDAPQFHSTASQRSHESLRKPSADIECQTTQRSLNRLSRLSRQRFVTIPGKGQLFPSSTIHSTNTARPLPRPCMQLPMHDNLFPQSAPGNTVVQPWNQTSSRQASQTNEYSPMKQFSYGSAFPVTSRVKMGWQSSLPANTTVLKTWKDNELDQETDKDEKRPWSCACFFASVVTIVSCCLPCAVIGLLNIVIAQSEYQLGQRRRAKERKSYGCCCTSLAALLGIGMYTLLIYIGIRVWQTANQDLVKSIECFLYRVVSYSDPLCPVDLPVDVTAKP